MREGLERFARRGDECSRAGTIREQRLAVAVGGHVYDLLPASSSTTRPAISTRGSMPHESGETMRSIMFWGHPKDAGAGIPPIFKYRRRNIEFHDGGYKLEGLAAYYFVTRDAELVRSTRDLWQREVDLIVKSLDPKTGLLPREKYCSDIETPVISINANANCWRGLRDMGLVLADIGEKEQAEKLAKIAAEYRKTILATIDKALDRSVDPPFLPIALGEETVHDPITGTRLGSYWNLVDSTGAVLWCISADVENGGRHSALHSNARRIVHGDGPRAIGARLLDERTEYR